MSGQGNDFYVGYLRLPWGHSRFLRVFIPGALWAMAALAAIMVWSMRGPGPARWDTTGLVELRGVLREHPYPMLIVGDEASGGAGAVLLATIGKHGAQRRVAGLDGRLVRVRGTMLERGARRMLEIGGAEDDVAPDEIGVQTPTAPPVVVRSAVVLRGEIVDAKCFMGAMKPGDGMGHRACAALCVQGGLPPLLVVPSGDGEAHYLFTDGAGSAQSAWAASLVGEAVEVEGAIVDVHGAPTIRATTVRRLRRGYSQSPSP